MALPLEPDAAERTRSVPIKETISRVPGYPRKLVIFKIPASSYWWVRYYNQSKILKRTTKSEIKRDALEAAKRFFEEIHVREATGQGPLTVDINPAQVVTFAKAAQLLVESEQAKCKRGQLTKMSFDNLQLRLNKHILPHFSSMDVRSIGYKHLNDFLATISSQKDKLSVSTISAYMGVTRKVLQHAARLSFIDHLPEFPKVGVEDKPRGWFNISEYKTLYKTAKKLAGKKVEWRAFAGPGEGSYYCMEGERLEADHRLIKRVQMTHDLSDLIVFMVNSYVRPTDIKNMQHKHVDIVRREFEYLRLSLPPSKGHSYPITTMPWAVRVYERICERRKKGKPEDYEIPKDEYVFMPDAASRDDALKKIQRQFEIVMDLTGLRKSRTGEDRTLYSLRHSSIMFRLLYGRSIDTLTLARNARTSPEMIDRFYAAPLQGEMNVGELQSKRRPRPWE